MSYHRGKGGQVRRSGVIRPVGSVHIEREFESHPSVSEPAKSSSERTALSRAAQVRQLSTGMSPWFGDGRGRRRTSPLPSAGDRRPGPCIASSAATRAAAQQRLGESGRPANTEARTRFADPARQGMLATVTDLIEVRHHADPADTDRPAGDDTGPLDTLESRAFLGEVLDQTRCADTLLGRAAAAWIGEALADPPFVRSPAEVAGMLGVRPRDAHAAIGTVRGIAGRILTDNYGVPAPTAAFYAAERSA